MFPIVPTHHFEGAFGAPHSYSYLPTSRKPTTSVTCKASKEEARGKTMSTIIVNYEVTGRFEAQTEAFSNMDFETSCWTSLVISPVRIVQNRVTKVLHRCRADSRVN